MATTQNTPLMKGKKSDVAFSLPYFLSAQLDGTKDPKDPGYVWGRREGWFGLIFMNMFVWISVVVMDIHLLAYEFNVVDSRVHILQTAALTAVCVSAGTILVFAAMHYCSEDLPFSSGDGDEKSARILPPFATALMTGGLRATLGFTYLILLTADYHEINIHYNVLKILVAQVALKHFGIAMALANQRLALFTQTKVVSSTN